MLTALRLLCAGFLCFIAGAAAYHFQVPPYRFLHQAFLAARALQAYYFPDEGLPYFLWVPTTHTGKGVTYHEPDAAYDGLTLLMSTHAQAAHLIDMQGNTVHRWAKPFREVWPDPPHVSHPVPPDSIYWRAAQVDPNGDLLVVVVGEGDTPWGYGLLKLNRDSELLWAFADRVHHDFAVLDDGRIALLTHRIVRDSTDAPFGIQAPYMDDELVILSADGTELDRVSLLDAFARSDYAHLVREPAQAHATSGDFLHTNTVEPVRQALDRNGLHFRPGQIMLSMRNLDCIAVLDLDSRRIEWALRHAWRRQHDPDLLDNGNVLLFDNRGGPGGRSRLLEIDPTDGRIVWQYAGDEQHPFYSSWRGRQQRLPNGNVLVTESSGGRLFELTRDQRVVWEYINPVRGGEDDRYIPWLTGGQRYSREQLPFLDAE